MTAVLPRLRLCRALRRSSPAAGFSLLELLLAFGLGVSLCALSLQAVLAEGHTSRRLARVLRERLVAERAFALLRADLQRATAVSLGAEARTAAPACNLAGRQVVLHLWSEAGPITYSVGRSAEPIWRGQVLLRCGGAFDLEGRPSAGAALNRVLLDGLSSEQPAIARSEGPGSLRLRLRQQWTDAGRASQVVVHERLLPAP